MTLAKRDNGGKAKLGLIPMWLLHGVAKRFEAGGNHYGRWNWANGFPVSEVLSSTLRHLSSFQKGEDIDPDPKMNGTSHIDAAITNLIMLKHSMEEYPSLDDRIKKPFDVAADGNVGLNVAQPKEKLKIDGGEAVLLIDGKVVASIQSHTLDLSSKTKPRSVKYGTNGFPLKDEEMKKSAVVALFDDEPPLTMSQTGLSKSEVSPEVAIPAEWSESMAIQRERWNIKKRIPIDLYRFLAENQALDAFIFNTIEFGLVITELNLINAFYFGETLEGFHYWSDLHTKFDKSKDND